MTIVALPLALVAVPGAAAPGATVPGVAAAATPRDALTDMLSQRLFPLLDALARQPAAMTALAARPDVAEVLHARAARREACVQDATCIAQAMIWTPHEAAVLAAGLTAAISPTGIPSADDGPAAQAAREIEGINGIVRTYALGQVPRYPAIDGTGTIAPEEARARVQSAIWLSQTPRRGSTQALDPSADFALALLDASDRTDAIGFAPSTGGLNAVPIKRAHGLDWKRYRYSAMIVTGVGPETPDTPLSAFGKYHLRLAATRFAQGDIAFIIVTGGRAHPRATRFTEAEEMRRALIERYAVPADAIVIEPYARHTTTNLRNATRLLMAMGAPLAMDTLIVCNPVQSAAIESPGFLERNRTELGYQPGTVERRLSLTALEFRPALQSGRVDPRDPLDP